ncbi:MAG: ABC transporter ATP-binding protein [bacterium]|nr:ABC transporter ATP-binding protein [bacterium]
MSRVLIEANGLGKQYRLGQFVGGGRPSTIRDAVTAAGKLWFGKRRGGEKRTKSGKEYVWALRDVSFDLREGEVLGVVGRNGAGKTTLLKILSRITEPTTGSVTLRGRVASLLEVGTGFHPELTGKENVYLNGVALGMSRFEIKRKFDEIVEFAGVESFIDTPVKRFSSGMQLRLAFAVAAHLDPEILIIDEVLAVGDAAFQSKCLRKMESVARNEGRTILFVSHNMGVIRTLCTTGIYLEDGQVRGQGPIEEQIGRYLATTGECTTEADLSIREDRSGDGRVRIVGVRLADSEGNDRPAFLSGQDVRIEIEYEAEELAGRSQWAISLFNQRGDKICHLDSGDRHGSLSELARAGVSGVVVRRLPLPPGAYSGDLRVITDGVVADYLQRAFSFRVEAGDFFGTGRVTPSHGEITYMDHRWDHAARKGSSE